MLVDFFIEILFPLAIALIVISIVFRLVSMLLELIKLDMVPIRLIAFLGAYYFVGPYLLGLVEGPVFPYINPIARFFYIPVQTIIEMFN
jgi:hypothetical protein